MHDANFVTRGAARYLWLSRGETHGRIPLMVISVRWEGSHPPTDLMAPPFPSAGPFTHNECMVAGAAEDAALSAQGRALRCTGATEPSAALRMGTLRNWRLRSCFWVWDQRLLRGAF